MNKLIPVRVINPINNRVIFYKNTKLGVIEGLTNEFCLQMIENNRETLSNNDVIDSIVIRHQETLNVKEVIYLKILLSEFKDLFSISSTDCGLIENSVHCIMTGDSKPINIPPRRIYMYLEKEVEKMVEDLKEKKIIKNLVHHQ